MNEELLLTFLAAAHEGSFTKAAKLRSYSVPSVMSQINELENYLGVSLFFRTNRGITLTKAGKTISTRSRRSHPSIQSDNQKNTG